MAKVKLFSEAQLADQFDRALEFRVSVLSQSMGHQRRKVMDCHPRSEHVSAEAYANMVAMQAIWAGAYQHLAGMEWGPSDPSRHDRLLVPGLRL